MKVIKLGNKGDAVKAWQNFLNGCGFIILTADGNFGLKTEMVTKQFQSKYGLTPDGVVGNSTYAKAMQLNFLLINDVSDVTKSGPNWPIAPNFKPFTAAQLKSNFGEIKYTVEPNGSTIKIINGWYAENMQTIKIPQLENKPPYFRKAFNFHKKIAARVQNLFQTWDNEGLADRILTFDGDFNPRLIRGAKSLSTHAYGISFDINADYNRLGASSALVGEKGSVRELVLLANKLGFYWGGHFKRQDGMHFEVSTII